MKKLILLCLLGLSMAGFAFASDRYLIDKEGAVIECEKIDANDYYISINCVGYVIDLSSFRSTEESMVKPRPLANFNDGKKTERDIACFNDQSLVAGKCYFKKDLTDKFCQNIFGINSRLDEKSKNCVCRVGYSFQVSSNKITTCRIAPITKTSAAVSTLSSTSTEQMQNQIKKLIEMINKLKAQLAAMKK